MFGFHGALAVTAMLNWNVPCDLPLQWFLLFFGLAGLAGSVAYFVLEVVFDREQLPGIPDPRRGGRTPKLVVSVLLLLTIGLGLFGVVLLSTGPSSSCHVTSPIVYKWAYAASLAFSIFGSLLVLVPLLAIAMPFLAVLLMPFVACLATCAQWMDAVRPRHPSARGNLTPATSQRPHLSKQGRFSPLRRAGAGGPSRSLWRVGLSAQAAAPRPRGGSAHAVRDSPSNRP